MTQFTIGLIILILGYLFYGRVVELILGPDDRKTPAVANADGVDFVKLPQWKNMLIQLLNIAGVGPVIGVIFGIKFGEITFVLIPVGNVIGGAVHDFVSGMMSIRNNGANLPALIKLTSGNGFYRFFSVFMGFLLLLVVAVFVNIPAKLSAGLTGHSNYFWFFVIIFFTYYIIATLFPVDKIIGHLYPIFGGVLLLGTFCLFVKLMLECVEKPELLSETIAFRERMFTKENNMPIIPMLFVTIACGIMSGFHATQSPIIARTMASERQARASFYGMMVVEGFIAMVWAAAGMAIYNLFPALMDKNAAEVLVDITKHFLNGHVGTITVISVIVLSITSGDTAMRSLRLSLAEIFKIDQKTVLNRIWLVMPMILLVALLLLWSNQNAKSFSQLWNYFAWGNQVLAACTLIAATIWLGSMRKPMFITIIPGAFMTFIVFTYILWISPAHSNGNPVMGFGLELQNACMLSVFFAFMIFSWAYLTGRQRGKDDNN